MAVFGCETLQILCASLHFGKHVMGESRTSTSRHMETDCLQCIHRDLWDDPDNYQSFDENTPPSRRGKAQLITAFDNRAGNGEFLVDERHTIAVVGDPMAPPVVGDSLLVLDTRKQTAHFKRAGAHGCTIMKKAGVSRCSKTESG